MNRLLRQLLVLLVAIAIPLQGFAGVAGLRCVGPAAPQASSPRHDHAGAGHHHAGHADDVAAQPGQATAAGGHPHGGAGHAHCGPCAACCAAAFISPTVSSLSVPAASSEAVAFVLPPAHAINPEPLDRPPPAL